METTTATTWQPVLNWGSFDYFCASSAHRWLPAQATTYYGDDSTYAGDDGDDYGDDVAACAELGEFLRFSGARRSPFVPTQAYYAAADDAGDDAYYYAAAGDDVRGPRPR